MHPQPKFALLSALATFGLLVAPLVVVPTAGQTSTSIVDGGGSVPAEWINVREHGVRGDGSFDDTAAIQAVIDASLPGDTVYFPDVTPGYYRIAGSIRIDKPLTISGQNGSSEIRQSITGSHANFIIQSSNVTIRDMRIVGYEYGPRNAKDGLAVPADLAFFDTRRGVWLIDTFGQFSYGDRGDVAMLCDWDGDGIDTVGVYRPSDGHLYLRNTNEYGHADREFAYGASGDKPVCGDWDGDGIDTIGVYRPSVGSFFLRNANTSGPADLEFVFGDGTGQPIAGDWDGDGKDTVGLRRPANGFLRLSSTNTSSEMPSRWWGQSGDRVVTGDWNGDRVDEIGVYRRSNSTLYLLSGLGSSTTSTLEISIPRHRGTPLLGSTNSTGLYEYGPRNGAVGVDTSGGSVSDRLSNITITGNWIQRFSGRGINLVFVDDFVVTDNHVEDVHYGGIYVVSARRGLIGANQIVDIGDPETGSPFGNSYPIVVSANPASGYPLSEDIIIQGNSVQHAPEWTGIMNHGGVRILVVDNHVQGADYAYANTHAGVGSNYSSFINNYGEDAPREALWLVGPTSPRTQGASAIGNVFVNTAPMVVYDQENATATWNTFIQPDNPNAVQVSRTGSSYVDHNIINGALRISSSSAPPAVAPPAPTGLTAQASGSIVSLSWNYDPNTAHDSFYIESRSNGGTWQRVAYRPPHDGTWNFNAPTNPNWIRFNPLAYQVTGLNSAQNHEFRIRANNGDAFSPWSNTTN